MREMIGKGVPSFYDTGVEVWEAKPTHWSFTPRDFLELSTSTLKLDLGSWHLSGPFLISCYARQIFLFVLFSLVKIALSLKNIKSKPALQDKNKWAEYMGVSGGREWWPGFAFDACHSSLIVTAEAWVPAYQ